MFPCVRVTRDILALQMPARCDDFFQFWLQHGCLQDQTDVDFFALEPSADGFSNDPKVKVVQLRFLDD